MADLVAKTLEELEKQTTDGLDDSQLLALKHDYVRATVTLELKLWVSDLTGADNGYFRAAHVTLHGVAFLCVEPPDGKYQDMYDRPGALDLGGTFPHTKLLRPPANLPPVPPGCFCGGIFVSTWNANLIVAARSVTLEWTGAPEV